MMGPARPLPTFSGKRDHGAARDNCGMPSGRPELIRQATSLLVQAVQDEDVVLLDAFGRPITKDSSTYSAAHEGARERIHELLNDLLDQLATQATGESAEDIATALAERLKATAGKKYEFDFVDGKLTLPFRFRRENVEIKGHIPIYHLALLAVGVWNAHHILHALHKANLPCAAELSRNEGSILPTVASILSLHEALYQDAYLADSQERELIRSIDASPWRTDLQRRVQHYGYAYDYKQRRITAEAKIGPLPDWLQELALRLVSDKFFTDAPDQAIINEYQPGQGISAHVDCLPCFGPTIARSLSARTA
jgi:hypothetical protein